MIDIKSLRLDNWILYRNEPVRVYHIDRGGTTHFRLNDLPINKDTGCTLGTADLDFKAIPLSGEVLKACGFKPLNGTKAVWRIIEDGVEISTSTQLNYAYIDTEWGQASIKQPILNYLHELQNLYFALTGKELNYKP